MTNRPYMRCDEVIDFIADYLDQHLPEETLSEFERHLRVCPSCVEFIASYQRTVYLAKESAANPPEEVPEDLVRAILESVPL